jgi:hypothetical protein
VSFSELPKAQIMALASRDAYCRCFEHHEVQAFSIELLFVVYFFVVYFFVVSFFVVYFFVVYFFVVYFFKEH